MTSKTLSESGLVPSKQALGVLFAGLALQLRGHLNRAFPNITQCSVLFQIQCKEYTRTYSHFPLLHCLFPPEYSIPNHFRSCLLRFTNCITTLCLSRFLPDSSRNSSASAAGFISGRAWFSCSMASLSSLEIWASKRTFEKQVRKKSYSCFLVLEGTMLATLFQNCWVESASTVLFTRRHSSLSEMSDETAFPKSLHTWARAALRRACVLSTFVAVCFGCGAADERLWEESPDWESKEPWASLRTRERRPAQYSCRAWALHWWIWDMAVQNSWASGRLSSEIIWTTSSRAACSEAVPEKAYLRDSMVGRAVSWNWTGWRAKAAVASICCGGGKQRKLVFPGNSQVGLFLYQNLKQYLSKIIRWCTKCFYSEVNILLLLHKYDEYGSEVRIPRFNLELTIRARPRILKRLYPELLRSGRNAAVIGNYLQRTQVGFNLESMNQVDSARKMRFCRNVAKYLRSVSDSNSESIRIWQLNRFRQPSQYSAEGRTP
ncbi:Hypothetical_protein [Hexamita inflata]|uniref:Hypothetical_protein n=1 Tax=Hexamita inflata TaxID=28002 RepID=A0AA86RF13_9EUKA|nr:Hypothetical protein HINF_LOCUS64909 [Hexamita inflata]